MARARKTPHRLSRSLAQSVGVESGWAGGVGTMLVSMRGDAAVRLGGGAIAVVRCH